MNFIPTISPKWSKLEREFAIRWKAYGRYPLVDQHKAIEGRNFAFDFAHLASRVAIEVDGGLYGVAGRGGFKVRGGHQSITGYTRDCEKGLLAAASGWVVIRLVPSMMRGSEARATFALINQIIADRSAQQFQARQ